MREKDCILQLISFHQSQIEYAQHSITLAWGNLGNLICTTSHTISVRGTEDKQGKKKTVDNTAKAIFVIRVSAECLTK